MKETRPCVGCGASVTRMPSRFVAPPDRTYCGTACRNRANRLLMDPSKQHRFVGGDCPKERLRRGESHPCWKGDAARTVTKRRRAQRAYPVLGLCVRGCGRQAIDRHHKDGDTGNNVPENIEQLCRICHMETDGRLGRLRDAGEPYRRRAVIP